MKDSGEPSWDPAIYELAHSIVGAYFEAVDDPKKAEDEPAITAGERERPSGTRLSCGSPS